MHSAKGKNARQVVLAVVSALSDHGCPIPNITENVVNQVAGRIERELWALVPAGGER